MQLNDTSTIFLLIKYSLKSNSIFAFMNLYPYLSFNMISNINFINRFSDSFLISVKYSNNKKNSYHRLILSPNKNMIINHKQTII